MIPKLEPLLFDVPRNKTRLQLVKEQHGIETHDSEASMGDARWLALLMPACRKLGYGVTEQSNMVEIMAHVGRLVDEAGYSGYGPTEADAVLALAAQNKIPIVL